MADITHNQPRCCYTLQFTHTDNYKPRDIIHTKSVYEDQDEFILYATTSIEEHIRIFDLIKDNDNFIEYNKNITLENFPITKQFLDNIQPNDYDYILYDNNMSFSIAVVKHQLITKSTNNI
jgi:hypothetical protein